MPDERPEDERRSAFEAALGGEYFALNGLRSSTTAEASARAAMFFATLTGTLLALGFLAGSTDASEPVAYAAVPTVAVLGILSFLRLVELAVLDVRALQGIQRIRSYWGGLLPEAETFFPRPTAGAAIDIVLDTGERRGLFRSTLTMAATVGLVDSLWIGAAVGFASADAGVPVGVGVALGVVVGIALVVAMFRHQTSRFYDVVGRDEPPPSVG